MDRTTTNSINLHKDLKSSSWSSLYTHLRHLSSHPSLLIPTLTQHTDPIDPSTTLLHTIVWKAPPKLALLLIELLPTSCHELCESICMAKDVDGNTPLHLYCANLDLELSSSSSNTFSSSASYTSEQSIESLLQIHTAITISLLKAAPRALPTQNIEGDTPLHLFVSSSLCTSSSSSSSSTPAAALQILSILLNHDSKICTMQDSSGATPLHVAISSHASDSILSKLIQACPHACSIKDECGMIPLHYIGAFLYSGNISVEVVQEIIQHYPEGVIKCSVEGDTPLHLAVSNASSSDSDEDEDGEVNENRAKVVELLMGEATRAATPVLSNVKNLFRPIENVAEEQCPLIMSNREKLTPLHCCVLFDTPPALASQLMKHPLGKHAAIMTNTLGATPLHLAVAQPDVTRAIGTITVIGTPDAAATKDRSRRTPLHVAAQNIHATDSLINAIVGLYPDAATVKTQRGHLPLHIAAQSQAKERVVKALITAFPQAAEARNKSSSTPLHDAAKYRASAGVVKLLLETYPDAVYIQNQYGNLPLHCATAYQAPQEVVRLLLEAWPDAASMQNRNQETPLHYAAAYAHTVDTVQLLIDAAPAAILSLNSSGQSPFDRAKEINAPNEVLDLFERSADALSQQAANEGWGSFPAEF